MESPNLDRKSITEDVRDLFRLEKTKKRNN